MEEVLEVVAVLKPAGIEVDSEEKHWRGLLRDPSDGMAQSIFFWRPLLHCFSFSLGLSMSPLVFLLWFSL